ncbi:MAG TPA: HAD family phosphatase [Candidatus Paceibacterota bacterium]
MLLKAVIMDFDGVILDSFREGLRRIKWIATTHDIPWDRSARRKLTELWGAPGIELLKKGLGVNEALALRMYTDWEKLDEADPIDLIPGARETLIWLRKNNFLKCLITSRHRESLLKILDADDLISEFEIITTKQDCPYHKPDPRVFVHCLDTLQTHGISKEHCIFIGDTPSDILAGKNAGIETLIVQTGPYLLKHAAEHPIDLGNILQSIDDLPMWVEEHHGAQLLTLPK